MQRIKTPEKAATSASDAPLALRSLTRLLCFWDSIISAFCFMDLFSERGRYRNNGLDCVSVQGDFIKRANGYGQINVNLCHALDLCSHHIEVNAGQFDASDW